VAPLAEPGVLAKLPGWLLRADSPICFRPRLDPAQWRWGLSFLAACNAATAAATTRRLLLLSGLSRRLLHAVTEEERLDYSHSRTGKLVVHSDATAFASAKALMRYQATLGCQQQAIDVVQCCAAEPALTSLRHRLLGGIWTPDEETGDCRAFCLALAEVLRSRYGVRFIWGTPVVQLLSANGRMVAAMTPQGAFEADAYVVCAGAMATQLCRSLGLALPLYPLKGYSLTLPISNAAAAPQISITDAARKVVYARLGDHLRVAGMADLVGPDLRIWPKRLALLLREARAAFPEATNWTRLRPWTGLRPATPTGAPILGPVAGLTGLHLDVGQGALGFTLAMASGRIVADLLQGRSPPVAIDGFRPQDHGV
jgi:D-amino-acid dehydrogenase